MLYNVRFSGDQNKGKEAYDRIIEVNVEKESDAYEAAYPHYWQMCKDKIESGEVSSHPGYFVHKGRYQIR